MANPFITISSPAADATVPTTFSTQGSFGGDLGKRATVSCSLSYPDNPIPLAGMVHQGEGSWTCTFTGVPPTDASGDLLGEWLEQHCLTGGNYRCQSSDLYAAYKAWCERGGEEPMKQKSFGTAMSDRGFQRQKSCGIWYLGVALRARDGWEDGTMG